MAVPYQALPFGPSNMMNCPVAILEHISPRSQELGQITLARMLFVENSRCI
jgi:hypothetical protein